jgi:hypothetical protein
MDRGAEDSAGSAALLRVGNRARRKKIAEAEVRLQKKYGCGIGGSQVENEILRMIPKGYAV